MIYDELVQKINDEGEFLVQHFDSNAKVHEALREVVELHKPWNFGCSHCINIEGGYMSYPCPTIQAIEKELL
jgi:hypothetical protein